MRAHNDRCPNGASLDKILPAKEPKTAPDNGDAGLGIIPKQFPQRIAQNHLDLAAALDAATGAVPQGQKLGAAHGRPALFLDKGLDLVKALRVTRHNIKQGTLIGVKILLALFLYITLQGAPEKLFFALAGAGQHNNLAPELLGKTLARLDLLDWYRYIEFEITRHPHGLRTNNFQPLGITQALGKHRRKAAISRPHQPPDKIGRASCRERVESALGAGPVKQKKSAPAAYSIRDVRRRRRVAPTGRARRR